MLSKHDIERIKEIKRLSSMTLNQSSKALEVIKDCAVLSSGTIATLTGKTKYSEIDEIQSEFIAFVNALIPSRRWNNWMEAWDAYRAERSPK